MPRSILMACFHLKLFLDKMNRLIARPVVQLARRPLISSAETGGHAWYRSGFTAFKSHPSIFRYLGTIYLYEKHF